jgi:hypothetical protein
MSDPTMSDLVLMRLFHAVPYEIREKIQRFTYKSQSKPLLTEIQDFHKAKLYLQELTRLIDLPYGLQETTEGIHERLWTGLNYVREKTYKEALIKNWKYKSELHCAEQQHVNGEKAFRLLDWNASFAVYFWMCIHH